MEWLERNVIRFGMTTKFLRLVTSMRLFVDLLWVTDSISTYFCYYYHYLNVFVVIECTGFHMNEAKKRVYRARFSSVTEKDISKAMDNLVEPNRHEALAVDARQEIDLKVGVAFTRFQTRYFQGKYGNLDSRVISLVLSSLFSIICCSLCIFFRVFMRIVLLLHFICLNFISLRRTWEVCNVGFLLFSSFPFSRVILTISWIRFVYFPLGNNHLIGLLIDYFSYGPCQTPTLGFCVQRYLQINTFKPEKFWALRPYIIQNGYDLQLEWKRQKLFDIDVRPCYINIYWCCSSIFYELWWLMFFFYISGCYNVSEVGDRGWNSWSNWCIRKTGKQRSTFWSEHSESFEG